MLPLPVAAVPSPVFKIVTAAQWAQALEDGVFRGAPVDVQDGFIHLSALDQVEGTARKHFAGQGDLLLVAVDPTTLGEAIRWEVSRGGALFPHLYAPLDPARVLWAEPLPRGTNGLHRFDGLLP